MKKILGLIAFLLLNACMSHPFYRPSVEEINLMEYLGVQGKNYQGKIWRSDFVGSGFCTQERAYKEALKNAAKQAKSLGYNYFSVLSDNTYTPRMDFSTLEFYPISMKNTTITEINEYKQISTISSIPVEKTYNLPTVPHSSIIFIVLDEKELSYFQKIFSVEDYLK